MAIATNLKGVLTAVATFAAEEKVITVSFGGAGDGLGFVIGIGVGKDAGDGDGSNSGASEVMLMGFMLTVFLVRHKWRTHRRFPRQSCQS